MTNTKLLEKLIKDSGLKKSYLAQKAGISLAWFRACCINEGEFRESQMHTIAIELHFDNDPAMFMAVFFAQDGAFKAPN